MVNEEVRRYYDLTAEEYAERFFHELDRKPFDRMALKAFHEETAGGIVCDMGCGPGEIAAFLRGLGARVRGIDASERMIREARKHSPDIAFEQGDMLALPLPDRTLAGIAAFYSIVHFTRPELAQAFGEWRRVLKPGGVALIAFHAGAETVHVAEAKGVGVSVDFFFFDPGEIVGELERAGFTVRDVITRSPYPGAEYPSRRCYIFAIAGRGPGSVSPYKV